MTGELLDAILVTIPLWGPLVFVMVSDLSDSSDRSDCAPQTPDMRLYRENWRQRRSGHGF